MDSKQHLWTWVWIKTFFLKISLNFCGFSPPCFSAPPPHVAVDCGVPEIPEDGILQLVYSDELNTQYKDQIHFTCSSKYYTLEGDGDYFELEHCSDYFPWLAFKNAHFSSVSNLLFYQKYLFNPSDTYTCSASGDWVSGGDKKEMPKCTEGTTLYVLFLTFSHMSCFWIKLIHSGLLLYFSVRETWKTPRECSPDFGR